MCLLFDIIGSVQDLENCSLVQSACQMVHCNYIKVWSCHMCVCIPPILAKVSPFTLFCLFYGSMALVLRLFSAECRVVQYND